MEYRYNSSDMLVQIRWRLVLKLEDLQIEGDPATFTSLGLTKSGGYLSHHPLVYHHFPLAFALN